MSFLHTHTNQPLLPFSLTSVCNCLLTFLLCIPHLQGTYLWRYSEPPLLLLLPAFPECRLKIRLSAALSG